MHGLRNALPPTSIEAGVYAQLALPSPAGVPETRASSRCWHSTPDVHRQAGGQSPEHESMLRRHLTSLVNVESFWRAATQSSRVC